MKRVFVVTFVVTLLVLGLGFLAYAQFGPTSSSSPAPTATATMPAPKAQASSTAPKTSAAATTTRQAPVAQRSSGPAAATTQSSRLVRLGKMTVDVPTRFSKTVRSTDTELILRDPNVCSEEVGACEEISLVREKFGSDEGYYYEFAIGLQNACPIGQYTHQRKTTKYGGVNRMLGIYVLGGCSPEERDAFAGAWYTLSTVSNDPTTDVYQVFHRQPTTTDMESAINTRDPLFASMKVSGE